MPVLSGVVMYFMYFILQETAKIEQAAGEAVFGLLCKNNYKGLYMGY